ncbi:MAG: hypothetical protein JNM91_15000 [Flavobacteriales bacterium]|nr:hypothetical protein [Flavobacteriales bacterium]
MRRPICIVVLFVAVAHNMFATMDGWASRTPGGLQMQENMLQLAPGNFVKPLERWYFYKDHVLGKFYAGASIGRWNAPMDTSLHWFIVNEANGEVLTFPGQEQWEHARSEMGLVPMIWERWYRNDWRVLTNSFALILYAVFLAIPVLLLAGLTVLLVVKKILSIKYAWRGLTVIGLIYLVGVLLELYPQSF